MDGNFDDYNEDLDNDGTFETSSEDVDEDGVFDLINDCLLYTSPSPRDKRQSRMPSSA